MASDDKASGRAPGLAVAGKIVLVSAALMMMLFRFSDIQSAPFILDEPQLLQAAQNLGTGHFATVSPLVGSHGLRYGPSAVWFYGLVHLLVGPSPTRSILAMGFVVTGVQLGLAWMVARAFRGGWLLFATLVAWIASSPYQFFWSRLAWDQLSSIASVIAAIVLIRHPLTTPRLLLLGVILGLGVSSHLMILPLVAIVIGVVALQTGDGVWARLRAVSSVLIPLILVTIPYLLHILRNPSEGIPSDGFSLPVFWEQLVEPARVASLRGIEYFFDSVWLDYTQWLGDAWAIFRLSNVAVGAALILGVGGSVAAFSSSDQKRRRLGLLSLLVWGGYALFYAIRNIGFYPHYQFPTWWIIPVGVAGSLAWLEQSSRMAWRVALIAVWLVAIIQFSFVAAWTDYIREREGTLGINYSVPVGNQWAVVRQACASPRQDLIVENYTNVFAVSLEYLASVTPSCRQKSFIVCPPASCPLPSPSSRLFALRYHGPVGAGVSLE